MLALLTVRTRSCISNDRFDIHGCSDFDIYTHFGELSTNSTDRSNEHASGTVMRHFAHDGLDVFYSTMYHNGWTTGELRSMYGRLLVQCTGHRQKERAPRSSARTYLPTLKH